ncbi:MAG: hypothetical protein HOI47_34000 [Candidatus Scalindua sp.]|jgi:hypothetical protein|nr:hypothetical protein [Candidatus Scalindua sp.]MBT6231683.1 hypothetical protein [Candidatus Scalindua sp.]
MANKLIGGRCIICISVCNVVAVLMLFLAGCVTTNTMVSSSVERNEIRLGAYKNIFIYPSEQASFVELELERVFDAVGLKVIGINEGGDFPISSVLGVRYTEKIILGGDGDELTIQLVDYTSGKTLFTTRSSTDIFSSRKAAWKSVLTELESAFQK